MGQRYDYFRNRKRERFLFTGGVRIAMVCYPAMGGSGVVATELAYKLACRGHEVHLVSSEPPFRLGSCLPALHFHEVVPPDYPVFRYRPYESALAGRLVQLARQGLDLIHVHYAIPHAVSALLAQLTIAEILQKKISFVTTLHGTDTVLVSEDPDLYPIVEVALKSSGAVTAVSKALASESQQRFGLAQAPQVIPNFVDTRRFSPTQRKGELRAGYASPEEVLFVHASNFRPIKQTPWLIALFARVLEVGIPARLLMIGDGPERPLCERQSRELGLSDRVAFAGMHQDIAPLLAIGDVFLLSSKYESFGLAALEALACGVPVVAPHVGGLPEVILPEAGLLYPLGNLEEALQAILRVLQDLPVYRAGARAVALRYDADAIVPTYERLYQQTLESVTMV